MDTGILDTNFQLLLLIVVSCLMVTPQVLAQTMPCDSDPCLNGGTCFTSGDSQYYLCGCQPGYTGTHCEYQVPSAVTQTQRSANEFPCPAGNFVDFDDVCDTVKDCPDASDEMFCEPVPACRADYERCPSSGNSVCIHPTWRCDGFDDCGDNSDENVDWCYEAPCPPDMVKCTNCGKCLPGRDLCDGVDDCQDGSGADEPIEFCTSADFTCPANHFHCHNGLCIPEHWVCDDDDDCGDGSDEDSVDCSAVTCRPGYFRCKRNLVRRSVCLPEVCLCDEIAHCEGAIDELPPICGAPSGICDTDFFQCANDLCIHESWVCDFENDCGDNSDEGDGCRYPGCSLTTEFTCTNGNCIRRDFACDGVNDCKDMSDEDPNLCDQVSMSSCGYLRNNEHGDFHCEHADGNTHGSVCTFSCNKEGYSLCRGMPQRWSCQDGSWDGPTSPICCDIQPPSLTCPGPMEVDAYSNLTLARVEWKHPQVTDNSGETLRANLVVGRNSGAYFDRGEHIVRFEATDSAGNTGACVFSVDVNVHSCVLPTPTPNLRRICSREDNIYGTTCRFECEQGWCTEDGSSTISCEKTVTNEYSFIGGQPTCKAVQCSALPIPTNGFMSDSCSTDFNSICTFACKSGFTLQGSVHRECGLPRSASTPCLGSWSGEEATCVGNTVVEITCPSDMTVFAQKNNIRIPVIWSEPVALDNGGNRVSVKQTAGSSSGHLFSEGLNTIRYMAEDGAGNQADCSFIIEVIVRRCNMLTARVNQQMTCTNDNIYGSDCSFTCNNGYRLTGNPSVTCQLHATEPVWIGIQPTCNLIDTTEPTINCPPSSTIYAPKNDVQALATWTEPSAIDNSGKSLRVSQTAGLRLGDLLPEGLHTIEYTTETDEAGNTAGCSFTVEVKVHRCNPLTANENQHMICTDNNIYGSTCSFTCNDGYCLTGNPAVICEIRGTAFEWIGEQPTCMPLQCQSLTSPFNGVTVGTCDTTYGSMCTFSCNPGYQIEGDSTRQCISAFDGPSCFGQWTGQPTVCRDVTHPVTLICPAPITQYTEPSATTTTVTWTPPQAMISGELVTATLREGNPPGSLFSEGQHTITYEVSNGQQCTFTVTVIARCTSLSATNNQRITCRNSQDNFAVGSTCDFTCDFGYCLEGQSSLTCSSVGAPSNLMYSWDGDLPVCKAVMCRPLQPPLNSQLVGSCDNTYSSTCSFECNIGYQRTGSGSRRCSASADVSSCVGTWSGEPSLCHDIEIPTITCPDSIARRLTSTETETEIRWDSPKVTDNSNENIEPVLKTIDTPPLSWFTEGSYVIEYEARDSAGNLASCSFFVVVIRETPSTCDPLMAKHNQEMSCTNSYNVGSTCTFTCNSGHCSDHSNSVVCENSGTSNQWNMYQPTCREITCSPLAPPVNAEILSGDSTCTTSPCRMTCKDGYKPIGGNRVRNCRHLAGSACHNMPVYWDGQELQCNDTQSPQFTNCPDSISVQAFKTHTMAFVQWDITAEDNSGIVLLTCDKQEGYMAEGNHPLRCTATDGNGNKATCDTTITVTVRRCPAILLELPQFASIDQAQCNDHYGGSCLIRCQNGYTVNGDNEATCEYDESQNRMYWLWSQAPTCIREVTQCSPLPNDWSSSGIQHHCTQSNSIGSMCTLSCSQQGYTLQNSPGQIICQADGTWNTDVSALNPSCHDTQPPTIDQCPTAPIEGELLPNSLRADIIFMIPQASDNSEQELRVITRPAGLTSPHQFASDTLVSYVFFDEAGNSATCSFQVIVKNNLPPTTVSCPENMEYDSLNEVAWEIPRFENPHTKEPLTPLCNRYPTDPLQAGENRIECKSTNPDSSVEGVCEFSITVGANSLPCRELPPISNGHWSCHLDTCSLKCNKGFDVPKHSAQTIFICGDSGWLPFYPVVTKCTALRNPTVVAISTNTTGSTSTTCPSGESDIMNTVSDVAEKAKGDSGESCIRCEVVEPAGNCQKEETEAGRPRRSTPKSKLTVCFKVQENELQQEIVPEKLDEERQKLRKYAMKIISIFGAEFQMDEPPYIELNDELVCEPGTEEGSKGYGCVPCGVDMYESRGICQKCAGNSKQPFEGMTWCISD